METQISAHSAILHVKIVMDIQSINALDAVILHYCCQVVPVDNHALLTV